MKVQILATIHIDDQNHSLCDCECPGKASDEPFYCALFEQTLTLSGSRDVRCSQCLAAEQAFDTRTISTQ
jgi:hypothetical protein